MLRGPTIRHVNIINHRFSSSAASILKRFTLIPQEVKDREGWGSAKFSVLTPGFVEFSRLVKEYMRDADVIYCCTPGVEAEDGDGGLFDASILTSHEGRKKGRLICAVGGIEGERRELPDELVKLVTRQHVGHHRHFHKHADEGGVVVVDTLEGAMKYATELVAAKVEPTQMVEYVHKQTLGETSWKTWY
jgi:ornithine cyclodeaminase/alanine dehydrogenase-like protein (mu-crystallin family)